MMNSEPTYEELMGPEIVADEDLAADTKLKAHDLFLRLQNTFSEPAYITLEEVRDATGFDGVRTADAMAISLYRSRGKAIWGFEMKVSRADWLKELKQPEKSESILRFCNYWALVVSDKNIVKEGELPPTWGLYVAQKNRLKCLVPCPKLEPIPMNITMLTALLYNVENKHRKLDEKRLREEYDKGYQLGQKRTYDSSWEKNFKTLEEKVKHFEEASGLQIQYGWNNAQLGEAVKALLGSKSELKRALGNATWGIKQADDLRESFQKYKEVLEKVINEKGEGEQ
jgi:hypothetical protein